MTGKAHRTRDSSADSSSRIPTSSTFCSDCLRGPCRTARRPEGFPAGANPNGLGLLVDIAGWVELAAAIFIGFGILTRLGAGALVVMMIVAYFGVHAALSPVWPWPHLYPNPPDGGNAFVAHGGEVTILWFIIAGIIGVLGSRKWGLERHFFNKEYL